MRGNLISLIDLAVDDSFDEFKKSAINKRESAIAGLELAINHEEQRLAQEAELDRLRKEKAERKRQEYEVELQRKAAEDARLDAERRAREESARIELEKQEAVRKQEEAQRQAAAAKKAQALADERAKNEAADAERRRLADIEQARLDEITRQKQEAARQQAEHEKRVADLKYKNRIKAQARDSLMATLHIDARVCSGYCCRYKQWKNRQCGNQLLNTKINGRYAAS